MSLVIGIEYLNGWALATHPADRLQPEWPPHPDRVFMALAAAHFEADGGEGERQALQWLESQGSPTLLVSESEKRTTVTTFVPVNDESSPVKKGKALMPAGSLPIGRDRQPRQFPVAIPHQPTAFLVWDDAEPDAATRDRLAAVCSKVASIGHSASFVRMWIADGSPDYGPALRRLAPVGSGPARYRLRTFGPGRLERLDADFSAGLRPTSPLWQGYALAAAADQSVQGGIAKGCFDHRLVVLRQTSGRRYGLASTLLLTAALRNALMKHSPIQPPPEWISGHRPSGEPSQEVHMAFMPMAHVGRQHADGRILGFALVLPAELSRDEAGRCLMPLLFDEFGEPKPITLTLGAAGECVLEADDQQDFRVGLSPETWTAANGPEIRWATVTPIALDRHARSDDPWSEAGEIIADGCIRIGLPRPTDVIAAPTSMFNGAPLSREMPRIERKRGGGFIRQVHAIITFPEAVVGPVLIGAGRYRGYGLCRPLKFQEGEA